MFNSAKLFINSCYIIKVRVSYARSTSIYICMREREREGEGARVHAPHVNTYARIYYFIDSLRNILASRILWMYEMRLEL